ncbi:MAG: CerR family C-terminal domain-containing protein [Planctomycetota bacterium]
MSNDSTKERILLAAGPVFANKGFKAATVREICEAAQVNVASINYYFGDKQALYHETVIAARQMRVKEVPYPVWAPDASPEDKLRDFVLLLLNRLVAMKSEPWQVRLLMREVLNPTETSRHLVQEYFRPFFEVMLSIVDDMVEESLSESKRWKIGFSIVGQCLYYRFAADVTSMIVPDQKFEDEFNIPALAEHISSFSIAAIKAIDGCDRNESPKSRKSTALESGTTGTE